MDNKGSNGTAGDDGPGGGTKTAAATTSTGDNANASYGCSGFVDTSRAERSIWLMKCPPVVSRSLSVASPPAFEGGGDGAAPSFPVAKVIFSVDLLHGGEDNSEFMMELASTESGNIPRRYSMEMSKDFIPMSVFSESSQGKISVEGKILHKFDMRPHGENIESYGKLCRERTTKCMNRARQIQVIDHDTGSLMRPMAVMEKKKVPTKVPETKRTRRDRGEMEEIMFKLFERQPNWTLRQLIQETDQPEQFLKDILKDLCVYNNKGPNQGTYELKPEYKKSTGEPTSG
ncbi:general transcription factor IIF subunit 2 [Eucalyptus grandis]|uniref:Uncharacterized protein n=2 Tax=Eucalyptus grandis TaxID=71139 RepID=A0ACC3K7Y0_EUCGR|nr:general transcription factor IIF subunit 2 [Eucalyptus grandis]KAK3422344.1 hypothetical protein EUGRSUZ_G02813 [Eucalyptus grandis]